MDKNFYRIDDMAVKTGLTKRALRYYEDLELIKPTRSESGYRLYTEDDVEKLKRIVELKENLGFTLNDIKNIMTLEKNLKSIFRCGKYDKALIDKAKDLIIEQINLVDEKEATLKKVKMKCKEILTKLEALYEKTEEENHEER